MKKLNLAAKGVGKSVDKQLDAWVDSRVVPKEPELEKKLTVRMPVSLHKKFKQKVLADLPDGANMTNVVIEIIETWCQGNALQLSPDVLKKLEQKARVSGITPVEVVEKLIEKWCAEGD